MLMSIRHFAAGFSTTMDFIIVAPSFVTVMSEPLICGAPNDKCGAKAAAEACLAAVASVSAIARRCTYGVDDLVHTLGAQCGLHKISNRDGAHKGLEAGGFTLQAVKSSGWRWGG